MKDTCHPVDHQQKHQQKHQQNQRQQAKKVQSSTLASTPTSTLAKTNTQKTLSGHKSPTSTTAATAVSVSATARRRVLDPPIHSGSASPKRREKSRLRPSVSPRTRRKAPTTPTREDRAATPSPSSSSRRKFLRRGTSWRSTIGRRLTITASSVSGSASGSGSASANSDHNRNSHSNNNSHNNNNNNNNGDSNRTTTKTSSPGASNGMQNGQPPSSTPTSGTTKHPKRKSTVLNASRKVVTTVGRPLRAVGRAVSGNRRRTGSHDEVDIAKEVANANAANLARRNTPSPTIASSAAQMPIINDVTNDATANDVTTNEATQENNNGNGSNNNEGTTKSVDSLQSDAERSSSPSDNDLHATPPFQDSIMTPSSSTGTATSAPTLSATPRGGIAVGLDAHRMPLPSINGAVPGSHYVDVSVASNNPTALAMTPSLRDTQQHHINQQHRSQQHNSQQHNIHNMDASQGTLTQSMFSASQAPTPDPNDDVTSRVGNDSAVTGMSISEMPTLSETDVSVQAVERVLREVVFLSLAYLMGTIRPEFTFLVGKTIEYSSIAWITCLVILVSSWLQQPPKIIHHGHMQHQHQQSHHEQLQQHQQQQQRRELLHYGGHSQQQQQAARQMSTSIQDRGLLHSPAPTASTSASVPASMSSLPQFVQSPTPPKHNVLTKDALLLNNGNNGSSTNNGNSTNNNDTDRGTTDGYDSNINTKADSLSTSNPISRGSSFMDESLFDASTAPDRQISLCPSNTNLSTSMLSDLGNNDDTHKSGSLENTLHSTNSLPATATTTDGPAPSAARSAAPSAAQSTTTTAASDANAATPQILTDADLLPHPSLSPFYIMDDVAKQRIYPNAAKPTHISNEFFEMDMLVIIRTPDVDDPKATKGKPSNARIANYLRERQRRFEFQYQMRVKKVPPNKAFYFSCELDEPIKMGLIQRAFVGASMAFMKSTNPTFHYSTMGSKYSADGKYEKPHMSFTVEGSLDRLVVTKPGETPPQLGSEIYEPQEHIKKRKKGNFIKWNTTDTYTMALWSAYVDFLDWRVINLPGIRPFLLTSVLGDQAFSVSFYMIDEDKANEKHYRKDITEVVNLELCNVNKAGTGKLATTWIASQKELKKKKKAAQAAAAASAAERAQKADQSAAAAVTDANTTVTPKAPASTAAPAVTAAPAATPDSAQSLSVSTSISIATSPAEASPKTPAMPSSSQTAPASLTAGGAPRMPDFRKKASSLEENDEVSYVDDSDAMVASSSTSQKGAPTSASTTGSSDAFVSKQSNLDMDDDNEDEDAATAAELGQGLYLQSGDTITLKQFVEHEDDDNDTAFAISNGAGFAVLQNQGDCVVTIEKARKSRRNKLIKAGDTVYFKARQKRHNEYETRYLTIHRGWWLKWVSRLPKKNGHFTICSADKQSESSYLSLGSAFKLRHKRWSSYYVGVANEPSPTYGGRLLALYNSDTSKNSNNNNSRNVAEDEYDSEEGEGGDIDGPIVSNKKNWMKILILYADDAAPAGTIPAGTISKDSVAMQSADPHAASQMLKKLKFSKEDARIDVPAWIEMMNRTERIRQLTYVVRINHPKDEQPTTSPSSLNANEASGSFPHTTSVRLRTGRELAPLMRYGLTHRSVSEGPAATRETHRSDRRRLSTSFHIRDPPKAAPLSSRATSTDGAAHPLSPDRDVALSLSPRHARSIDKFMSRGTSFDDDSVKDYEGDLYGDCMEAESINSADFSVEMANVGSHDEWADTGYPDEAEPDTEPEAEAEPESEVEQEPELDNSKNGGRMKRGKMLIGKVAKKAKDVTVATGKTAGKVVVGTTKLTGKVAVGTGKVAVGTGKMAMRQSKKVVRGSVSTGKSVIQRKPKKNPRQEPRTKAVFKDKKSQDQTKHVEVSKEMKKIGRSQMKMSNEILAGELCAPEQSCRIASSVLSKMSNLDPTAVMWARFNDLLKKQLSIDTEQDRWFLQGNHVHIGVTPLSRGEKLHDSLVARCLWESHWREEWCGVYKSCISFYSPLSKSPCLEISYIDITNVRPLDSTESSPLPGFPLLVLETAWLCHYMAFRDEEARDTFGERIEAAIAEHVREVEVSAELNEKDLRKARFWQGFQNLSEAAISPGRGKWAKIMSNQKSKERAILNSRRMVFDLDSTTSFGDARNGYEFIEKMLATALSFSMKTLETNPESFVQFLDAASHLRLLPLHELNFNSKAAYCLFMNLYHVILQHAMLLSINGPLNKRSIGHFVRTTCYEVGGDVFSLAELHCCVLRGRLSRPSLSKPPYIEPPKKSVTAYRVYALTHKDPRLVFCVNTADTACPRHVPILREKSMDEQLNACTLAFLKGQMVVDTARRVIILPKVCEVYRHDFGSGDTISCVRLCISELKDDALAKGMRSILSDDMLQIRYRHTIEQYHTSLLLRRSECEPDA